MFLPPIGSHLTDDQARELDDRYLRSRPLDYFASRIAGLVHHADRDAAHPAGATALALSRSLGLDPRDLQPTQDAGSIQVAVDSFALRHQSAETLVRLFHALTIGAAELPGPRCLWAAIAQGPKTNYKLVQEARTHLATPNGHDSFWQLVLAPEAAESSPTDPSVERALNVMGDWLNRAMDLLTRDDIDINAANNKAKHGLAVRATNDLLMLFTTEGPGSDGTVPLSSVSGPNAIPLLDSITLEYLSRPPGQRGGGGLELSTLRLDTSALLAEAWMMATTHASMFSLAARAHFANRTDDYAGPPDPPSGPTPSELLGHSLVGLRQPATWPTDPETPHRKTGLAFELRDFLFIEVDYEGRTQAIVAEDFP